MYWSISNSGLTKTWRADGSDDGPERKWPVGVAAGQLELTGQTMGHRRRQGVDRPPPNGRAKKELTLCLHLKDDICVTDILKISKITWNYLHFFYKISKNLKDFTVSRASIDSQRLSLAPGFPWAKSGRACYDKPTGRRYFYQMSNMSTCIAYLIEIWKFCSKNLVYKGVNFEAKNALKLTYEHL